LSITRKFTDVFFDERVKIALLDVELLLFIIFVLDFVEFLFADRFEFSIASAHVLLQVPFFEGSL
jgi:hypothetical protein